MTIKTALTGKMPKSVFNLLRFFYRHSLVKKTHIIGYGKECDLGGNFIGGNLYPDLWKWLIKKYSIYRVLDVGCGLGESVKEFRKSGCIVTGIEGLTENIVKSDVKLIQHDLTRGPFISEEPVDLVWACELLEHIEEDYISNVMETISQGKIVAATMAEPGRPGHHHVNCKPWPWWKKKFACFGLTYMEDVTRESHRYGIEKIRNHDWWIRTGRIFKNSAF